MDKNSPECPKCCGRDVRKSDEATSWRRPMLMVGEVSWWCERCELDFIAKDTTPAAPPAP